MHKLDLQLQCLLDGDYDQAWTIAEELEAETPHDNRAAFNRGWHLLRRGEFAEGYRYLDRGRLANVFAGRHPGTFSPIWSGTPGRTVMLRLEGGLGDQIHGLRFINDIVNAGSKAIVCCSPELAPIANQLDIGAVCQVEAMNGVYHDAWLPSMSAPLHLGHTRAVGTPYIPRPQEAIKGRIGLRWAGNPKFENSQHRRFPLEPFFDAVKSIADGDVVSLQRDLETEAKPDWVQDVKLETWLDTQNEIAKCEKVITSCTAIAHLAGAMGVETYVLIPQVCYYLWAFPGVNTDNYDSVKLFRQKKRGDDWKEPFDAVKSI